MTTDIWELKKNLDMHYSAEFWYDLFDGGYFDPEKFLESEMQAKKVRQAMQVIECYKGVVTNSQYFDEM